MIEHVDRRMAEWVVSQLGEVVVAHDLPILSETPESKVHLYLLDLQPAPAPSGGSRPPQRWILRYLLATAAASMAEAHRLLGELAVASLETGDFEVESGPLPLELWRAMGLPPRPALILRVPMMHETPRPRAPLVQQPLVVSTESVGRLQGVVLGPHGQPIVGARVEALGVGTFCEADADGRFALTGIPSNLRSLRVQAKGKVLDVETHSGDEPLVIRFQPLED